MDERRASGMGATGSGRQGGAGGGGRKAAKRAAMKAQVQGDGVLNEGRFKDGGCVLSHTRWAHPSPLLPPAAAAAACSCCSLPLLAPATSCRHPPQLPCRHTCRPPPPLTAAVVAVASASAASASAADHCPRDHLCREGRSAGQGTFEAEDDKAELQAAVLVSSWRTAAAAGGKPQQLAGPCADLGRASR